MGKEGKKREEIDSAMRSKARIATLAVVQTVYPTIKSDARLCRGNPLASAGFKQGEPRMHGRGRARGGGRVGNKQKARRPAPIVGAFRFLAHCIFSCPSHATSYLASPYGKVSFSLSLPPDNSLRSYFPLPVPPSKLPVSRSGRRKKCVCVWTLAR